MSPLILVGILVLTTLNHSLADVKHVLEGSAHPPTCKCAEENHHHYQHHHQDNQFNGGFPTPGSFSGSFGGLPPNIPGSPNNIVPGSVAFWWADSNSPFKHAYEYFKKCSEKGNCLPPVSPGFQVSNTIQHGSVSASIDTHKGVSASTASPFGPVDIQKNPFLNGQINGVSGAGVTPQGGGQINLAGNPFFNGQAAYSGNGETVVTGSDGFLGVQPSVPFGKNQPKPFAQTRPTGGVGVSQQPFPTAHPSGGFGANQAFQPFPTAHPGAQPNKDGKFENCKKTGHVCVAPQLCLNGLVKNHGEDLFNVRFNVEYCEIGKEICCRLPEGEGTSYHPNQQSRGQFASSFSSSSSGLTHTGFANLSHITTGKSSVPGGTIKFSGSPGLSPGLIQVLPVGDEVPNPHISNAGETGSAHSGSSSTTKVVRDTTPSPNSLFSNTPDYSNDNLRELTFHSTIKGPEYLPPVDTSHISTYKPSVPTTSPFVTKPIIPGSSVVSVYTPSSTPKPFVPSFSSTTQRPFTFSTFSTTQRPFISSSTYTPFSPSSPKPFDLPTQPQNVVPSYTPRPQTQSPNQYIPPYQPSPSPSQNTFDSFPTRPSVSYSTQPPFTRPPTYSSSYVPPQTPVKPTLPPYRPPTPSKTTYIPPYKPSQPISQVTGGYSYPTPTPSFTEGKVTYVPPTYKPITSSTYKPYTPPTYKPYSPSVSTSGYKYPTPTPPFVYPSPKPDGSINVNTNYIPPKQPTPGYSYPTPTPAFTYGSSTPKPIYPSPSIFTNTYVPPKTTPKPFTFTNYIPPKTTPKPQYTPGYSYPTPTPAFNYPKPPPTPKPDYSFNNNYYTPTSPKPTPKPYYPSQSTSGYHYPSPTPAFVYPSPSPSTQQPTRKPVNNGYLPPEEKPEGTNVNDNRVPYPTTKHTTHAPTYIPPLEGEPNNPIVVSIRPDQVQPSACAAALKCVPETYCTADGFISSTPVVLSREQEYLRVPTTDCSDSSGVIGKCCRDPNYVDPWPSANLINGIDNGQYREDPTLGQYFPQKQRPARSESSGNIQNSLLNNGVKGRQPVQQPARIPAPFNTPAVVAAASNNDNTCGIRNPNIEPHGPGSLDAGFAEIPWQAMILRDTNRSLLCGGVIVKSNAVLTAAHCVEGLATTDILIKAGEWKLGIDEEPLPFQISKVAAIIRHPNYQPGVYLNDLALLMLEERLRVVDNVAPICLPANNQPPAPQTQCIVTGWGKHVLQVHLRDAIMRLVDVNILDNNQCSETLNNKYQHILQHYSPQSTICAYSSQDQCKVDYGSALACTNGNGQYTLAGIFGWDTGCKDETQIGGYIPPDVEWIESTCSRPLTQLKALDRQYRNNYQ